MRYNAAHGCQYFEILTVKWNNENYLQLLWIIALADWIVQQQRYPSAHKSPGSTLASYGGWLRKERKICDRFNGECWKKPDVFGTLSRGNCFHYITALY